MKKFNSHCALLITFFSFTSLISKAQIDTGYPVNGYHLKMYYRRDTIHNLWNLNTISVPVYDSAGNKTEETTYDYSSNISTEKLKYYYTSSRLDSYIRMTYVNNVWENYEKLAYFYSGSKLDSLYHYWYSNNSWRDTFLRRVIYKNDQIVKIKLRNEYYGDSFYDDSKGNFIKTVPFYMGGSPFYTVYTRDSTGKIIIIYRNEYRGPPGPSIGPTVTNYYSYLKYVNGKVKEIKTNWDQENGYYGPHYGYNLYSLTLYDSFAVNGIEPVFHADQYTVFPIPFEKQITISFPEDIYVNKIQLYSITGKIVEENEINKSLKEFVLDAPCDLAQGIYILKIFTSSGIITKKVIVRKN